MENYNTEEILRESQLNVKKLNEKLKDIETLHNEIKESVNLSLKNPVLFKELAEKLNDSAELYLKGNNALFEKKIVEISSEIAELNTEINRLSKVDFTAHFNELEANFLETTRVEFKKELDKLDQKTNQLKTIKDDLEKEAIRFSKIDLEAHFEKHQNKLSEVFIAVNGINGILTTLSQNTIRITQTLGDIEQSIKTNHSDIKQKFENIFSEIKSLSDSFDKKTDHIDLTLKNIVSNNQQINDKLDTTAKKQQTNTYITWGIIVLGIIAIILTCKN